MPSALEAEQLAQRAVEEFDVPQDVAMKMVRKVLNAEHMGHHLNIITMFQDGGYLTEEQAQQLRQPSSTMPS